MSDHRTSTQKIRSEAVDQAVRLFSVSGMPDVKVVVQAAYTIARFVQSAELPGPAPVD